MIDYILRLDIKPLTVHNDGKRRSTTLTSFESVLDSKKTDLTTKENITANSSENKLMTKKSSQNSEDVSDSTVRSGFRDPVTGQTVTYKDVAEKKDESTKTDKLGTATVSDRTTTADSMKKTKYDSYFKKAAKKYNVSESLLKAIAKAESGFNAKSVSSAGAMGVMQLMPATAKGLGVTDPYDPEQNIMGGAKCISQKLKEFNGDERMALAAYNAGSGAVRRYGGIPSYCKTYVNRVQSYKRAFQAAGTA